MLIVVSLITTEKSIQLTEEAVLEHITQVIKERLGPIEHLPHKATSLTLGNITDRIYRNKNKVRQNEVTEENVPNERARIKP